MNYEDIREVVSDVFGRNFGIKRLGGWASMKCPLATWKHEKGHDNSPSAGVSIQPDDMSIFNCFTCHTKLPFGEMLAEYAEYSGEDLSDLVEEIRSNEFLGPRVLRSKREQRDLQDVEYAMPIDEGIYMDLYEPAAGHPYLAKRGISSKTAEKLELLYDPKDSENEPRILFPVRGPDGLLYGFSGRATLDKARLKVRDYFGLKKAQSILGSHLAGDAKRIIIVEGLVDYAMVHEMGECGCAVMHSTFTDEQREIVCEIGKPTYLMYDNDKAGKDGNEKAAHALRRRVPVFGTKYPRVKIEDDSPQGWHWLKDPGEMLDEELQAMLRQAYLL